MADPIPIYKDQDFYVPHFEVRLASRALPADTVNDVQQVTYKDNVDKIDECQLTINNWDAEKRTFKYSDSDLFLPGEEFELRMGYYGGDRLRLMLRGVITSLRPSFPSGGSPTLAVEALNILHTFREVQRSHTYENMTDGEIAHQIGEQRLGLKVDPKTKTSGEERYKYIIQDNQPDVVFLMERARRVGYDVYVEEKDDNGSSKESVLFFGPSESPERPTYELTYGRSLVEFSTNLTTATQVARVSVQGWDATAKKEIRFTARRDQLATKGVGKAGNQAGIEASFEKREEVIATKPVNSLQEAKTLATETLEKNAKELLTGSASTVGLPDLRAGNHVVLNGLGTRFSGRYFVTATTHSIGDSGYTTQFDCRREEIEG